MPRQVLEHRDWHSGPKVPCDMFSVYESRYCQQIDAACQHRSGSPE